MTVDELTDLLEAVPMHSEVRVVVFGDPPQEYRLLAVAKGDAGEKPIVLLLTSADGRPAEPSLFDLDRRIGR